MKIAFHSYKGGVGRTKLMVAVGALWALQGRRVGMLDFDLDSSGLATIFNTPNKEIGDRELLHILHEQSYGTAQRALKDVTSLVVERFGLSEPPKNARLRYLPTLTEPKLADKINLADRAPFLAGLFKSVEKDFGVEYVLVDVKPGFSPSFNYVLPLVDRIVEVSRLDTQNIRGLEQLLPSLEDDHKRPLLVANMVPESKQTGAYMEKLELAYGKKLVDVQIPYDPELLFDDDFACLAGKDSIFRKHVERLADLLLG